MLRNIAFHGVFAVILSKSITVSIHFIKLLFLILQFFLIFCWILSLRPLSRYSPLSLTLISIVLMFFYRWLLILPTLQIFTMIQVTYIFLQKLNELTFLTIEICWDSLAKVPFDWRYSFLPILVRKRLIHFVFCRLFFLKKFASIEAVMRWRYKSLFLVLGFNTLILRGGIIFLNIFRQKDINSLFLLTNTFCILEMWLFFWYLFLTSIFLIQFVSLGDLFILLSGCINTSRFRTSRSLVLGAILLKFELLFDVVQILLIHLRENIIRFLLFRPHQLRRGTLNFRLWPLTNLYLTRYLLA